MANTLSTEKKIAAVGMLCEGNSIRSIERLTGVHRDTIMRLGVRIGEGCQRIMDEKMRNLKSNLIQVDEVWGFIGKKQKNADAADRRAGQGDVWTWIALDSETKLVPSFAVGDRSQYMAVERAFGAEVDYGSIYKTFSHTDLAEQRRYSPPDVLNIKRTPVAGNPVVDLISTSHVEKQNHTLRMHWRRLTRLTNAFSKKLENFKAAVALHYGYYNFVKVNGAIRCTPAVQAGVTDSAWTVADLVERIEG